MVLATVAAIAASLAAATASGISAVKTLTAKQPKIPAQMPQADPGKAMLLGNGGDFQGQAEAFNAPFAQAFAGTNSRDPNNPPEQPF